MILTVKLSYNSYDKGALQMSKINTDAVTFIGERLCLNFANTASWHNREQPIERLINYETLVYWSKQMEIITLSQEKHLLEQAEISPHQAEKALANAIELREAIFRLFKAVATGQQGNSLDLAILNKYVNQAYSFVEITPKNRGYAFTFHKGQQEMNCMLWPIVQSAVNLLLSEDINRVKLCEGEPCGVLFCDVSRNKSRRWCSMEDCGNRAKAQRHYKKKINQK